MDAFQGDLRRFNVENDLPSCKRWKENMPSTRADAPYRRYIAARKLWRSKIEWQLTKDELLSIYADVSSAANQGDWGARALLAKFYREGLGPLDTNHILDPAPDKAVEIVHAGVKAGQPWAFYDMGVAHEHGYAGIESDREIAWAYYLKAAEMGSPDAQLALADAYGGMKLWEKEKSMLICAYHQEHGPAAYRLGMDAKLEKRFSDALRYYQDGTKFGDQTSAVALALIFASDEWSQRSKLDRDELTRLGISADDTRSSIYWSIAKMLEVNRDLRLGRLDAVLPLPPAVPPAWQGIDSAIEPEPIGPPTY